MDTTQILAEFNAKYNHKYRFSLPEPLGSGAYATVFKARDIDRNIDVAIKIFHYGSAPKGSQRGWKLTSRTTHPQIAPTHTVETFTAKDGTICKAVITRFIPGKTLQHFWNKYDTYDQHTKEVVADDLAKSFVSSLLEVLEICHKLKFGHGDLHAGNIMMFLNSEFERYTFHVVLIDFDNSSFKTDAELLSEKQKIESDVRASCRVIEATISEWKWIDAARVLFNKYDNIHDFKIAYDTLIEFIKIIEKKEVSSKGLIDFFVGITNKTLFKNAKPIFDAVKMVAEDSELGEEFSRAYELFQEDLKRYEFWHTSFEIEVFPHGGLKTRVYTDIFG